jgi:hypothetical protein
MQFIRELPTGRRFDLVAIPKVPEEPPRNPKRPRTLEEKLSRELTPDEQAIADAFKDRLFRPGWRNHNPQNG